MKNQLGFCSNLSASTKVILALSVFLLVLLAVPFAAQAQDITAAVRGTVSDEQGAAIVGADVTVASPDTGFSRSVVTGSDGVYNFPICRSAHTRFALRMLASERRNRPGLSCTSRTLA